MNELEQLTDQELMAQTRNGNKSAFEILVLRYMTPAINYCQGLIHDAAGAPDIVQDSFADIYVQRNQYQPTFSFRTYLYTLIRHKAVDYIRKYGKVQATNEEDMQGLLEKDASLSPEETMINKEDKKQIYAWLDELPPDYRLALILYCVHELSYQEIAQKMGKSTAQIKIYIYRARKKLQKRRIESL